VSIRPAILGMEIDRWTLRPICGNASAALA
jgi:hypothetical protein